MAIKASAQITISKVIDIYACYRYYKLQSSTLSKPDKPTTNPPSGWSDTEPAYVSGSTNTLYFVDCNVYSDKSFSFSEVSKSSSYEAAKDAWNKANNAQNTVDNLEIGGRNLVPQSLVQQQSMSYGFAGRTLTTELQAGVTYTISFCGRVIDGEGKLAVFLYEPTWKSATNRDTESKTNTIVSWTFKPTISGKYIITAYSYLSQGTHGGNVYVDWYKVEKGNKATDWTPAPEDMLSKDEAEDIYTTQLEMSKTNSELRMDFNKSIASATDDIQSQLEASNSATNQKFGEINKYIRFVDGKIILGETGNELTLTVQNDRVSFQQAGNEVAYFSNNNLYIKRAEVLTTLRIGNYEWTPRNDGGLALRKRGN